MKLMIRESNEIDMNDLKTKLENTFYKYFPNCTVDINPFKDDDGRDVLAIKAFSACPSYERTAENSRMYMDLFVTFGSLGIFMASYGCIVYPPSGRKPEKVGFINGVVNSAVDIVRRFDALCKRFDKTYKFWY